MHYFASGPKRNYYGKGDVTVYRLQREGQAEEGKSPVFGANVLMLLYGDAFWPTYTEGNNTGLVATDSMKNFIQRETLNFTGYDLESYCCFLAAKFLSAYPQTEGVQVSAEEIPYRATGEGGMAFTPAGGERSTARVELQSSGIQELRSGIVDFRLLRLGGSAFTGFLRDQYTTLPEIRNRPLHMWLGLDWIYTSPEHGLSGGRLPARVRSLVHEVFQGFQSGSIQQVIYQVGTRMLAEIPEVSEVNLEAQNRTWDTVMEAGENLGAFTEPRPPFGCLGLTLRR
ncbi:MAG TPA: urate oxidase [Bryobacteraceae bacterium]|nr:urate oxidase [Bryobacteraceae bacterium]